MKSKQIRLTDGSSITQLTPENEKDRAEIRALAQAYPKEFETKPWNIHIRPPRVSRKEFGGPGSGHHGHAGRPGERGGSSPGDGGGGSVSEKAPKYGNWKPDGGWKGTDRKTVATSIIDRPTEVIVAWDKDGNLLGADSDEDGTQVTMSQEIDYGSKGGVTMHNHPRDAKQPEGSSFSPDDMIATVWGNRTEGIVVTRIRGEEAEFVLRTERQDVTPAEAAVMREQVYDYTNKVMDRVAKRLEQPYFHGKLDKGFAWTLITHKVNRDTAKKFGWEYEAKWQGKINGENGTLDDAYKYWADKGGRMGPWAWVKEKIAAAEREDPFAELKALWRKEGLQIPDGEAKTFGGAGSGHHGHAGRPGERGGSAPGDGGGNASDSRRVEGSSAERIMSGVASANLRLPAPRGEDRKDIGNDATVKPDGYVLEEKTGDWWIKGTIDTGWTGKHGQTRVDQAVEEIKKRVVESGGKEDDVRVGKFRHGGGMGTSANIHNTASIFIRVQGISDEEAERKLEEYDRRRLHGGKPSSLPLTGETADKLRKRKQTSEPLVFGGPGSGHHGHAGVPGQRGGSAPGPGGGNLPEGFNPVNAFDRQSITDALTSGRFKVEVSREKTYRGEDFHFKLTPKAPENAVVAPKRYSWDKNDELYDPEVASIDEEGRYHLKPGYSASLPDIVGSTDGKLYRGMSAEEWRAVQTAGEIQSKGDYNLGGEEEGKTFYSVDPDQAESYAAGFQPWQRIPTAGHHAIVVEIADPNRAGTIVRDRERGVPGSIPLGEVLNVYEGVPYRFKSGVVEYVGEDYYDEPRHKSGSRFSPSTSVGWRKLDRTKKFGGPGSGNFGHAGRPGEVGGSAPSGGGSGGGSAKSSGGGGSSSGVSDRSTDREREAMANLLNPEEELDDSDATSNLLRPDDGVEVDTEDVVDDRTFFVRSLNATAILPPEYAYDGLNASQQAAIKGTEDPLRAQDFETGVTFGPNGEVLMYKDGEKDSVTFTPDELAKMRGNTFTHNHPSGYVLSLDDINLAVTHKLGEMRAVSKNNTFRMRFPNGHPNTRDLVEAYNSARVEASLEMMRRYGENVFREGDEAQQHERQNEAGILHWNLVARDLGMEFIATRR